MSIREDWDRMAIILTTENDEGLEIEVVVGASAAVCHRCGGKGKHDNPAFDEGITMEDWERDWDEESREDYLSGRYDVACETCKGRRVVLEACESDPNIDTLVAWQEDRADYLAQCAAERRMGA